MTRMWVMLALGLSLSWTALPGTVAFAQSDKAVATKAAGSKAGLKTCRARGDGGKPITWLCKPEQPCCYNSFLNKGVCGSTVIGCF